jgi:hypothetical protein
MTTPTDPQQDEKPVAAIRPGSWPRLCVQRAFVDGAVWHQWSTTGATPWSHERDAYEDEAVKRYGEPDVDLQQLRARHEALVSALDEYGQHKVECLIDAWKHIGAMPERPRPSCTCGLDAALAKAGA